MIKKFDKRGNSRPHMNAKTAVVITVLILLVVASGAYFYMSGGFGVKQTINPNNPTPGQTGTSGVAPSISLIGTDALTGQSVTIVAENYKDANTNKLLGMNPTFVSGQTIVPIINGTSKSYLRQVFPAYKVVDGPQQLTGTVYAFANETIQAYTNAGTGALGPTMLNNDSAFTSLANNRIVLTGNAFKSSGKIYVVYEVSNVTSVQGATLTLNGASTALTALTVPNCYANNLTGTSYKVGWEIPAIIGGTQQTYNLQTNSLNGKAVSGAAKLTLYNERDGVNTLIAPGTDPFLTSGFCDSNNAAYNQDVQSIFWAFA